MVIKAQLTKCFFNQKGANEISFSYMAKIKKTSLFPVAGQKT